MRIRCWRRERTVKKAKSEFIIVRTSDGELKFISVFSEEMAMHRKPFRKNVSTFSVRWAHRLCIVCACVVRLRRMAQVAQMRLLIHPSVQVAWFAFFLVFFSLRPNEEKTHRRREHILDQLKLNEFDAYASFAWHDKQTIYYRWASKSSSASSSSPMEANDAILNHFSFICRWKKIFAHLPFATSISAAQTEIHCAHRFRALSLSHYFGTFAGALTWNFQSEIHVTLSVRRVVVHFTCRPGWPIEHTLHWKSLQWAKTKWNERRNTIQIGLVGNGKSVGIQFRSEVSLTLSG